MNSYNYFFATAEGAGVLILAWLVISLLLAIVFERKTRKKYKDRGFKNPEDDWNNPDYEEDDFFARMLDDEDGEEDGKASTQPKLSEVN